MKNINAGAETDKEICGPEPWAQDILNDEPQFLGEATAQWLE
jgi:hypothetical protein